MNILKRIQRLALPVLIGLTLFSFIKKRELPVDSDFHGAARHSPVQTGTVKAPFLVTTEDGREHQVIPLYDYTIAGMVVSGGHSETLSDYYQDKLNVMDVGLIWGDNLNSDIYRNIKFHTNGIRLFWKEKNREAPGKLNPDQVSNNHLLCTDPVLKKRIKRLYRGDVVLIEGFLASYGGRKSSTTRSDSGDGACEVIWVDRLSLLRDGRATIWNRLFNISRGSLAAWITATMAFAVFGPVKR
jgi:hypothetical protein